MTDQNIVQYVGEGSISDVPEPSIFIQWKGTDVYMDFYCECGEHHHVDAEFVYSIRCGGCSAVYAMPSTIQLKRIEQGHEFYDGAYICDPEDES